MDSLTLNHSGVKNGKCLYFDKNGDLDSIVMFRNGKHDGLKSKFLGEYGTYTYKYENDSLIEERDYDTLNRIVYISPLDVQALPKTTYKLLSKRDYFDQNKGDSILLINPALPPANRKIEVTGALIRNLKDENFFAITTSKHFDSLKNILIKVTILKEFISKSQTPDRIDSILIPVK